ncbi:MAG: orotate phosphoribosyltransferase [Culicoidibacterales bacterium]
MSNISDKVIKGLVDIKAISINIQTPFIWASGIKSPIYCDNRKSIGHYQLRHDIAKGLVDLITEHYPTVDIIGGTATAGIPHATSVADILKLPMVYFRSKPKAHGTGSVIEGDYQKGQKIVIVEDLISTGGSVLSCVNYALEAGFIVLGVVSIFSYELAQATENFKKAAIETQSIAGFANLYQVLNLSQDHRDFIDKWRENPRENSIWDNI